MEEKIIELIKIVKSEEYKQAMELIKETNKKKQAIKRYCQKNKIMEKKIERGEEIYEMYYKIRETTKIDKELLEPEILERISIKQNTWYQYFKIQKK